PTLYSDPSGYFGIVGVATGINALGALATTALPSLPGEWGNLIELEKLVRHLSQFRKNHKLASGIQVFRQGRTSTINISAEMRVGEYDHSQPAWEQKLRQFARDAAATWTVQGLRSPDGRIFNIRTTISQAPWYER